MATGGRLGPGVCVYLGLHGRERRSGCAVHRHHAGSRNRLHPQQFGDVDILVNNLDGPPALLRNDGGNRNNWISIKCVGTRSNRSAIGTRVKVVTGEHSQIDEVMSGSSYYSQNDFRLHFGLARASKADTVEVAWPSGLKETLRDLPANHLIVIQETKGIVSSRKVG